MIAEYTNFYLFHRIKYHLEPLAIAANITQSGHCRLDDVLLTFAALVMRYRDLNDAEDSEGPVKQALIGSIERRWGKADRDVFLAAVILNPFIKVDLLFALLYYLFSTNL